MRFLSWGIVAACGFLLTVPAAKATDLDLPPSPHYNWTGFYAGVFGGGAYAAWAADYCRNGACRHAEGQAGGFAVGVDVLTRLHNEMGSKPVTPDLAALWRDLGLKRIGEDIEFDDTAPLAAIRKAITAPHVQ